MDFYREGKPLHRKWSLRGLYGEWTSGDALILPALTGRKCVFLPELNGKLYSAAGKFSEGCWGSVVVVNGGHCGAGQPPSVIC